MSEIHANVCITISQGHMQGNISPKVHLRIPSLKLGTQAKKNGGGKFHIHYTINMRLDHSFKKSANQGTKINK